MLKKETILNDHTTTYQHQEFDSRKDNLAHTSLVCTWYVPMYGLFVDNILITPGICSKYAMTMNKPVNVMCSIYRKQVDHILIADL